MEAVFPDESTERLFQLIHMLQRTALLNLGHLPHPEGGFQFNLPEAKEAIDLIGALQTTTKGNWTQNLRPCSMDCSPNCASNLSKHPAGSDNSRKKSRTLKP